MNSGNEIVFSYNGENKLYRLADPESGFIAKIGFRTKHGHANPANAAAVATADSNITLISKWFGHLFTQASFQIGSQLLENYTDVGTAMDVLTHLKPREYRTSRGE